jgi:hypothetical protein
LKLEKPIADRISHALDSLVNHADSIDKRLAEKVALNPSWLPLAISIVALILAGSAFLCKPQISIDTKEIESRLGTIAQKLDALSKPQPPPGSQVVRQAVKGAPLLTLLFEPGIACQEGIVEQQIMKQVISHLQEIFKGIDAKSMRSMVFGSVIGSHDARELRSPLTRLFHNNLVLAQARADCVSVILHQALAAQGLDGSRVQVISAARPPRVPTSPQQFKEDRHAEVRLMLFFDEAASNAKEVRQ